MLDRRYLTHIEKMNYIFGGVLVVVTAAMGTGEQVLGAFVGAALSAINFSLVRRLVEGLVREARGETTTRVSSLALAPKMLVLMGAVVLALLFLPISAVMFAAGFSVFLLSITVETVRYVTVKPPAPGDPPSGDL